MKQENRKYIIAIDGHSSCGKSTFARDIADKLRYVYIDSGAMYRAVTLYALDEGLLENRQETPGKLIPRLENLRIRFRYNADKQQYETWLNKRNVEAEIRRMDVSGEVSFVSSIPEVRTYMVQMQREIGVFKGVVMDGRDIGTVVFPDADLKIFLTARPEVRAQRRHKELLERGENISYEEVLDNLNARDTADQNRETSPLKKADDAILLDNSEMTPAEQMKWFDEKCRELGL